METFGATADFAASGTSGSTSGCLAFAGEGVELTVLGLALNPPSRAAAFPFSEEVSAVSGGRNFFFGVAASEEAGFFFDFVWAAAGAMIAKAIRPTPK